MAPRVAQNCTEFLLKWTVEDIEKTISWLMGWPAGLKLNSNLNKFLGEMFLWLISLWSVLLYRWTFSMDAIVRVVALTGIFGASTLLAAAMDAIRMVTFHLRLFYLLATRMYSWEVRVLLSLFHLFRGKKWNVLHGRLDKADYDLDQLLLGTVLFTALVFIFPTVAVYYVLFLISLWGWLLITLAAEIVVQCLRSMPVFELAVSLADPSSLVTGIHASVEGSQLCIVTQLKSPIAILRPLFTSIGRMVSPLISLQTIGRMVSGKILTGTEEKSELPSPLPLF
jgi:phosphatidylinositol glycan class Q protein